MTQKDVVLKNNALFTSCITNISSVFVDNAEDLDVVEVVIIFKHLSNFWKSLGLPLIKCEIGLDFPLSRN